jgi:excisionase family DNA binding protein
LHYKISEVAKILEISVPTVYKLVKSGVLKAFKGENSFLCVDADDLMSYKESMAPPKVEVGSIIYLENVSDRSKLIWLVIPETGEEVPVDINFRIMCEVLEASNDREHLYLMPSEDVDDSGLISICKFKISARQLDKHQVTGE